MGAEQVDRLVDATGGGGAGDPESGRELVAGVGLARVGEGEQCLCAGIEDPPAGGETP